MDGDRQRIRYFKAWCGLHGLEYCPAAPRTVGLFLTAHVDEWKMTTMKSAKATIARMHRDAGLEDPCQSPLVTSLYKALTRMKRVEPPQTSAPILTEDLARLCSESVAFRSESDEAITLRSRITLVLMREHDVTLPQAYRIRRGTLALNEDELRLVVPPKRNSWGDVGDPQIVVISDATDTYGLRPMIERLLELTGPDVGDTLLDFSVVGEGFRPAPKAVTGMDRSLRAVARRAGLPVTQSLFDFVLGLDEPDFRSLLGHCYCYALDDLRNRTLVSVGWALALRPGEARMLMYGDVKPNPSGRGFDVDLTRIKGGGRFLKALHHWPGCPQHCPSCLLARWLAESKITGGALFPTTYGGVSGKVMTDGNLKFLMRQLVRRAELDKHVTAKSMRSGYTTSAALAGAEIGEIMETTDHVSEDVVRWHYVLTNKGAGHQLGR